MPIREMLLHVTLTIVSACATGLAHAGPPVQVTFKNLGTQPANYEVTSSNEASTYNNATPKPDSEVAPQMADAYKVQSLISPDSNWAQVRYTVDRKTCVFSTTYVNQLIGGGSKVPKWSKTATPSGGAVCTATITSQNLSNHSWTVEFTMK